MNKSMPVTYITTVGVVKDNINVPLHEFSQNLADQITETQLNLMDIFCAESDVNIELIFILFEPMFLPMGINFLSMHEYTYRSQAMSILAFTQYKAQVMLKVEGY